MIKRLTLSNFQGIEKFEGDSFGEINVVIGENDTGKTALLKLMYSVLRSWEEYGIKKKNHPEPYKEILVRKLQNTFNPKNKKLGELVKKRAKELSVELSVANQIINFSFGPSTERGIRCNSHIGAPVGNFNTIFIPAKEVLTMFKAIELSRESLYLPDFDDSYLDLVKTLKLPTTKGKVSSNLVDVNRQLEELFAGEIKQDSNQNEVSFVYENSEKQKFSMSLTAEGIKKIGVLTTLIRNRSLNVGTILFMDEPEATLHPLAIRKLALMILKLADSGIQIFLSSHNYFLLKQLSILAQKGKRSINCISLSRNKEDNSVESSFSDLSDGLPPDNPIVKAALEMMDEELMVDLQ